MNSLKELYVYREMIFSLVRKDLRTRYKGSVLGLETKIPHAAWRGQKKKTKLKSRHQVK